MGFGRSLAVAICMAALAVGAADAQPSRGPAVPDSLRGDGILDRLSIHPTYTSRYQVNRTSRTWSQGLDLSRQLGSFDFSNRWSLSNRQDTAQNNLRQKRGQMNLGLNYRMEDFGSWTVGLDGVFRRDSQLSSFRDIIENRSNMGLRIGSGLPQEVFHAVLPVLSEFSLQTNANFGYSKETNTNRRASLVDTTWVGGLFQTYDAALSGKVRTLDMRFGLISDQRTGDIHTRQRNARSGDIVLDDKDTSENRRRQWDTTLRWSPLKSLRTQVAGRWTDDVSEYWDIQANGGNGGRETKKGADRSGQFQFEWTPSADATLRADLQQSDIWADYILQERDFDRQRRMAKVDGRYVLPRLVRPVSGTELTLVYSDEVAENSLEQTADYRQENRTLRASARRSLGSKIQVQVSEEVAILQYFYADRANDRDELRTLTEGVLTYRPNMELTGIFSVSLTDRQAISIPEERAGNNNTSESYRVSADLTYARGRSSINQRYTVQADYTFYDFNEDNNNLARTNTVNTMLRHFLGTNIGLSVTHQYQYRDFGSYVREARSGLRTYAPSSEETRHVLTLGSNYSIARVFRIEGRQLFDRRQTKNIRSGAVRTVDRAEFSLRTDAEKDLSSDFKIRLSFQKTESTAEKDYWTGEASLERRF